MSKGFFHEFIEKKRGQGLIVQPRMGFSELPKMKEGLERVRAFPGNSIGTMTLDSKTRLNQFDDVEVALREGRNLNGFPVVNIGAEKTREMLSKIQNYCFPVQVRHGSPLPYEIFKVTHLADIDSIEGGPVSYCLPYSKVPLKESVDEWQKSCEFWAEAGDKTGKFNHLESFGGCMMGQLCPPGMLIAITILEGLFFIKCGLHSISVSGVQGTNFDQDVASLMTLKKLASEFLAKSSWHVVLYTYMGLFPRTVAGARRTIEESASIAQIAGAERLIVKTVAEAHRIPTISDNLNAMEWAHREVLKAQEGTPSIESVTQSEEIYAEAKRIIEAVLNLHSNLGRAILLAFKKGILDIPFCLHPDNHNVVQPFLDETGILSWSSTGNVPINKLQNQVQSEPLNSSGLLRMLSYNQQKYEKGENYAN